jgi:hypothetical protein
VLLLLLQWMQWMQKALLLALAYACMQWGSWILKFKLR